MLEKLDREKTRPKTEAVIPQLVSGYEVSGVLNIVARLVSGYPARVRLMTRVGSCHCPDTSWNPQPSSSQVMSPSSNATKDRGGNAEPQLLSSLLLSILELSDHTSMSLKYEPSYSCQVMSPSSKLEPQLLIPTPQPQLQMRRPNSNPLVSRLPAPPPPLFRSHPDLTRSQAPPPPPSMPGHTAEFHFAGLIT